jgi:cation transport ATPase
LTSVSARAVSGRVDRARRRRSGRRLALGLLLAAVVITLALVPWSVAPGLRGGSWRWIALALDTAAVLCAIAATAATGFLRRTSPAVLGLVSCLVSYGWAMASAAADERPLTYVAAALVAVVTTATSAQVDAVVEVRGSVRPDPWTMLAVVAVAALALVGWGTLHGWDARAAESAVAVLAAGCPGAIVVARTAPLLAALRRGGGHGILVRDIEWPDVDVLHLDGLETVTDGKEVASVDPVEEAHLRNLRWFAGALEHLADDPIARAIARLSTRGNVTGFERYADLGVSGSVDRHPVRVGRPAWVGVTPSVTDDGGEVVGVEVDGRPLGTITVVDTVTADASAAVAELGTLGVTATLTSPEREARLRRVAAAAGIESVTSTPIAELVRSDREQGRRTAVLTAATSGADADVVLGSSPEATVLLDTVDVASGVRSLRLVHDMRRAQQRTRVVALALTGVLVVLSAVGVLTPLAAAAGATVAAAVTGLVGSGLRSAE